MGLPFAARASGRTCFFFVVQRTILSVMGLPFAAKASGIKLLSVTDWQSVIRNTYVYRLLPEPEVEPVVLLSTTVPLIVKVCFGCASFVST